MINVQKQEHLVNYKRMCNFCRCHEYALIDGTNGMITNTVSSASQLAHLFQNSFPFMRETYNLFELYTVIFLKSCDKYLF